MPLATINGNLLASPWAIPLKRGLVDEDTFRRKNRKKFEPVEIVLPGFRRTDIAKAIERLADHEGYADSILKSPNCQFPFKCNVVNIEQIWDFLKWTMP